MDHGQRRQEIVAALWRVVLREGITATSVRSVAAEAATSPSALRHYFATQQELLTFALRAVVDRARARLEPLDAIPAGRAGALRVMEQLLPLDADRRAEVEIYLAFVGRALGDPTLRTVRDEVDEISRRAVVFAIQLLESGGELGPGRDVAAEADRAYAVLDGLALHGAQSPRRHPPKHLRMVLRRHLDELATPAVR